MNKPKELSINTLLFLAQAHQNNLNYQDARNRALAMKQESIRFFIYLTGTKVSVSSVPLIRQSSIEEKMAN